jgi:hypothetical protein
MKKIFLAVLSISLLIAPSAASAHHSKRHSACRASARRHHARCAHTRARVVSFGPAPGGGQPTTAHAPSTPTSTETAGTVKSYEAPLLTIVLNDKTEVSGKVTENTRIDCEAPGETSDDDGGTENPGEFANRGDEMLAGAQNVGEGEPRDQGDEGDAGDQGDDDGGTQPCTTAALVPGAMVRAAELILGGEGAVWERVDLVS